MGVIHDGLSDEQFSGWLEASQVAKPSPPEAEPITEILRRGKRFTRTRNQLVSDVPWGFIDSLEALIQCEGASFLAHCFRECPWLHFARLPGQAASAVPDLTPTQRIVPVYLLEGIRQQDIARQIHVAEATVKDLTRAILRHFAVLDQLALVCKFRNGSGGDTPSDDFKQCFNHT